MTCQSGEQEAEKEEYVITQASFLSSEEFLVRWAKHFSQKTGTCYLHTGKTPTLLSLDHTCVLFLCPTFQTVEWDYKKYSLLELEQSVAQKHTDIYPLYGVLSYELGTSYRVRTTNKDPLYALFTAGIWATYSQQSQKVQISYKKNSVEEIRSFFSSASERFENFLEGKLPNSSYDEETKSTLKADILSWEDSSSFCKKVQDIHKLIHDGDVYQLNLSYEVTLSIHSSPFSLFEKLLKNNPSPQSAFLHIDDETTVISSSPERLLKRTKHILFSQPIKGTRPRGKNEHEDKMFLLELKNSEKERSELAMITDLVRNDLFHISLPGTISVSRSFHIDAYETVFQQSSQLSSHARSNFQPLQALASIFPGGSITGCPKERAMQRIHEIEQRNRGIYTGSIGYCFSPVDYDWNIAIRTLVYHHKEALVRFSIGSGIVWDSDPILEYFETLHKAKSLAKACSVEIPG